MVQSPGLANDVSSDFWSSWRLVRPENQRGHLLALERRGFCLPEQDEGASLKMNLPSPLFRMWTRCFVPNSMSWIYGWYMIRTVDRYVLSEDILSAIKTLQEIMRFIWLFLVFFFNVKINIQLFFCQHYLCINAVTSITEQLAFHSVEFIAWNLKNNIIIAP